MGKKRRDGKKSMYQMEPSGTEINAVRKATLRSYSKKDKLLKGVSLQKRFKR